MFSSMQKKLFFSCFLAYTCAYITRLNLSATLPSLMADLRLETYQVGFIQTLNALLYAAGQMVFGMLADKINPKNFILAGLSLSSLCNFLFGISSRYSFLLILWCLNGIAQSMLWTPIVTLISTQFEEKLRSRVAFGLSMSLIVGHLLAWLLSSFLSSAFGWRFSFILPAIIALLGTGAFALFTKSVSFNGHLATKGREFQRRHLSKKELFITSGLLPLLLVCIFSGFIRDGVINWGPTILSQNANSSQNTGEWISVLIIPLFNLAGILIGRFIYRSVGNNARKTISLFFIASIVFSSLLAFSYSKSPVFAIATLLGGCCAIIYGNNPQLTTMVPIEYAPFGKVGIVAGLIDSFIYIGSALSGLLVSLIQAHSGWQGVFFSWVIASCLALFLSFWSNKSYQHFKSKELSPTAVQVETNFKP